MPLEKGSAMPSLDGATEWFNATGARAEAEARGAATVVYFWSRGSATCHNDLSSVAALREQHAAAELHFIAVHVPQSDDDRDTELVREAITLNRLTEPCAIDNEGVLRAAFQVEITEIPAFFLFDAGGTLRSQPTGDAGAIAHELEKFLTS